VSEWHRSAGNGMQEKNGPSMTVTPNRVSSGGTSTNATSATSCLRGVMSAAARDAVVKACVGAIENTFCVDVWSCVCASQINSQSLVPYGLTCMDSVARIRSTFAAASSLWKLFAQSVRIERVFFHYIHRSHLRGIEQGRVSRAGCLVARTDVLHEALKLPRDHF